MRNIYLRVIVALLLFPIANQFVEAQTPESIWVDRVVTPDGDIEPWYDYTFEQLIEKVLISEDFDCIDINILEKFHNPNDTIPSSDRSFGYFRGNGNFPFESGIVLSTGFARSAEGPNDETGVSDPGFGGAAWPGDTDLQTLLNNLYGDSQSTNNATSVVFTFIPFVDEISFEYIFASDEYEQNFECSAQFRDGFAFLVKGPGIPDDSGTAFGGTNIAAVPGSNNIVVNTYSICTADPVGSQTGICAGQMYNTNWFPELYVSNQGLNDIENIEFDGRTVPLQTQTVTVIPGETYTMKLVIADRGDTAFDSAVFLNAGSLSLGTYGLESPDGSFTEETDEEGNVFYSITPCPADYPFDATLESELDNVDLEYFWYHLESGTSFEGVNLTTITVEEPGTYIVEAAGCGPILTSKLVVYDSPIEANDTSLLSCDSDLDGTVSYNLTDAEAAISTVPNSIFTYYEVLADAEAYNTNNLDAAAVADYSIAVGDAGTIIYVVVENDNACTDIAEITLNTEELTTPEFDARPAICSGDAFEPLPLVSNNGVNGTWSPEPNNTATTTYTFTPTDYCAEPVTLTVEVIENPVIDGVLTEEFGNDITVLASGGVPPYEYAIEGVFEYQTSNVFTLTNEGTYTALVRNQVSGCVTSYDFYFVPWIPEEYNVFTPNGDGINDVFKFEILYGEPNAEVVIYDRYGKEIVTLNSTTGFQWLGNYLNEPLPSTTYWFSIDYKDGRPKESGWILLRNREKK